MNISYDISFYKMDENNYRLHLHPIPKHLHAKTKKKKLNNMHIYL